MARKPNVERGRPITVWFSEDRHQQIATAAKVLELSASDVIRLAVREWLERQPEAK